MTKLLKEFHISEKCKQRANTEKQINHNIANTAFGSIQGVSVSIMIWYSLLFSSWRPQSPPDCSAGARPWCRCTGKGQGQCVIKGKLLYYRHVTFVQGHAIILATYEASHYTQNCPSFAKTWTKHIIRTISTFAFTKQFWFKTTYKTISPK